MGVSNGGGLALVLPEGTLDAPAAWASAVALALIACRSDWISLAMLLDAAEGGAAGEELGG